MSFALSSRTDPVRLPPGLDRGTRTWQVRTASVPSRAGGEIKRVPARSAWSGSWHVVAAPQTAAAPPGLLTREEIPPPSPTSKSHCRLQVPFQPFMWESPSEGLPALQGQGSKAQALENWDWNIAMTLLGDSDSDWASLWGGGVRLCP